MRSKFGCYSEYHTSLDNLDYVTPTGLLGGLNLIKKCINLLESNHTYKIKCFGEPQLGKRGLYPSISIKQIKDSKDEKTQTQIAQDMLNFLMYSDGTSRFN